MKLPRTNMVAQDYKPGSLSRADAIDALNTTVWSCQSSREDKYSGLEENQYHLEALFLCRCSIRWVVCSRKWSICDNRTSGWTANWERRQTSCWLWGRKRWGSRRTTTHSVLDSHCVYSGQISIVLRMVVHASKYAHPWESYIHTAAEMFSLAGWLG